MVFFLWIQKTVFNNLFTAKIEPTLFFLSMRTFLYKLDQTFILKIYSKKLSYIISHAFQKIIENELILTVFRMEEGGEGGEGGAKRSPTSFFPVTSTNVKFSYQIFPTFSFNPFNTLGQNFKFVLVPVPDYWTW